MNLNFTIEPISQHPDSITKGEYQQLFRTLYIYTLRTHRQLISWQGTSAGQEMANQTESLIHLALERLSNL